MIPIAKVYECPFFGQAERCFHGQGSPEAYTTDRPYALPSASRSAIA